jgi:hypothetical protein
VSEEKGEVQAALQKNARAILEPGGLPRCFLKLGDERASPFQVATSSQQSRWAEWMPRNGPILDLTVAEFLLFSPVRSNGKATGLIQLK